MSVPPCRHSKQSLSERAARTNRTKEEQLYFIGRVNQKQEPFSGSLSTPISPPSCSTMLRQMESPSQNNNEWFVRQEIKVECPKEANAKALDILNKGIDSLSFHVKAKELSAEYIETLLKDICAECVELTKRLFPIIFQSARVVIAVSKEIPDTASKRSSITNVPSPARL